MYISPHLCTAFPGSLHTCTAACSHGRTYSSICFYFGHNTGNIFLCSCFMLKKPFRLPQMSVSLTAHLLSTVRSHHPHYHVVRDTLEERTPSLVASFHGCSSHWGHHAGHFTWHQSSRLRLPRGRGSVPGRLFADRVCRVLPGKSAPTWRRRDNSKQAKPSRVSSDRVIPLTWLCSGMAVL